MKQFKYTKYTESKNLSINPWPTLSNYKNWPYLYFEEINDYLHPFLNLIIHPPQRSPLFWIYFYKYYYIISIWYLAIEKKCVGLHDTPHTHIYIWYHIIQNTLWFNFIVFEICLCWQNYILFIHFNLGSNLYSP